MLTNLTLTRPLAVLDLETTGIDIGTARIVEISVLRLNPSAESVHRTRRLNPEIPIPAEATAVHGITDADVTDEPCFSQVASGLANFLDGCDLCGYNVKKFDLRVLYNEFRRAGIEFSLEGRAIIDPMEIFHTFEKRDLTGAVHFYLGRDHTEAHSAETDVLATVAVLEAMLERYRELPQTVGELNQRFIDPNAVDSERWFIRVVGEVRFTKGKHRGEPLSFVARNHRDYLRWMLAQDLADDTRAVVRHALDHNDRGIRPNP